MFVNRKYSMKNVFQLVEIRMGLYAEKSKRNAVFGFIVIIPFVSGALCGNNINTDYTIFIELTIAEVISMEMK